MILNLQDWQTLFKIKGLELRKKYYDARCVHILMSKTEIERGRMDLVQLLNVFKTFF